MSYFLFGYRTDTITTSSCDNMEEFIVNYNCPELVRQMLKEQCNAAAAAPFILATGELSDSSDNLISPFGLDIKTIKHKLLCIEAWIISNWQRESVGSLFITEGYDCNFTVISVYPQDFTFNLCEVLARGGDWPSLKIDVEF